MSQSVEKKVTFFSYDGFNQPCKFLKNIIHFLDVITGKLFPDKRNPDSEEVPSRRFINQTVGIVNASENTEFQKAVTIDGNEIASFLTSEKYTVGTELQVVLSETFERNKEKETIKTCWSGIVTRIQLQKKHETYLIEVKLNVCLDEHE